jgi:hypothetical protein
MTIAPAPVAASPVTGQPIATTRCLCSGHLAALRVPAPTETNPRRTETIHAHTGTGPTCEHPTPAVCGHVHCWDEIHPEPVGECVDGLADCCSCCLTD